LIDVATPLCSKKRTSSVVTDFFLSPEEKMDDHVWNSSLSQKQWTQLIQRILLYLTETNPDAPSNVFKTDRQVLPNDFTLHQGSIFCYAYKGTFLPSGNADGKVWKPSQAAKPTGPGLMKRYFYCKEEHGSTFIKVKRQVVWLTQDDSWCFLDYRFNYKGKVTPSAVGIPDGFDFQQLISDAMRYQPTNANFQLEDSVPIAPVAPKVKSKSGYSRVKRQPMNSEVVQDAIPISPVQPKIEPTEAASTRSFLPQGLTNFFSMPLLRSPYVAPPLLEDSSSSSPVSTPEPTSPDSLLEDLLKPEFQPTPMDEFTLNANFLPGLDDFTLDENIVNIPSPLPFPTDDNLNNLLLTPPPFPTDMEELPTNLLSLEEPKDEDNNNNALTKKRKLNESSPGIIMSGFDYLLSHILSYDQIIDTLCQNICSQLIFNRRFFQKTNIDTLALFEKAQQHCVMVVDLGEFPSNIITNFFQFLFDNVCSKGITDKIPDLYCLVCGKHVPFHDTKVHKQFYGSLDQSFVNNLQQKGKSMYGFIKEVIAFLLKYPNARQPFKNVVAENLHCPFCAATHGVHCAKKHNEWKKLWNYSAVSPSEPSPELADQSLDSYTKSTFEFLMSQMPFYIPSFLFSLPNARTFLDCLITLWKVIRLL